MTERDAIDIFCDRWASLVEAELKAVGRNGIITTANGVTSADAKSTTRVERGDDMSDRSD